MDFDYEELAYLDPYQDDWPILPSTPVPLATNDGSEVADEDGLGSPDEKIPPATNSSKVVPGCGSSTTTVTTSPQKLPSLLLGNACHPQGSNKHPDLILSSRSPSPQPKRVRFMNNPRFQSPENLAPSHHAEKTVLSVPLAPQLPPAPSKAEAPDTFRDFRRRYAKLAGAQVLQGVSSTGSDLVNIELQRRTKLWDVRGKLRVPELEHAKGSSSDVTRAPQTRKCSDGEPQQCQQKQRLAETLAKSTTTLIKSETTSAMPPYGGASREFILACTYLESLLRRNDTALHQSLWDDFVRFYTSVWMVRFSAWKQNIHDEDSIAREDSFLSSLTVPDGREMMEPPLSMYCTQVSRPLYAGCVLSPQSLPEVLHQYPGLAKDAKAWILSNKPWFGREGRPHKRSTLWE